MRLTSTNTVYFAAALMLVALSGIPTTARLHAATAVNRVNQVTSVEDDAATTITISGTSTPTFTVYKLDHPSRLVVDIAGAQLSKTLDSGRESKASFAINTWAVQRVVASGRRDKNNRLVRVVVSLARASSYRVKAVGEDLVIRVRARESKPKVGSSSIVSQAERDARVRSEATARLANERARQAEVLAAEQKRSREQTEKRLEAALTETTKANARAKRATQLAAKIKKQARIDSATAATRLAAAENRIRSAKLERARAEKLLAAAEQARRQANNEAKSASAHEKAAQLALAKAAEQRRVADQAERSAARYRQQAEHAKATGSAKSTQLTARANQATAKAVAKRRVAESAARTAEQRRREAERAEKQADQRTRDTAKALAAAGRQLREAERARVAAETARDRAAAENRAILGQIEQAKQQARAAATEAKNFTHVAKQARQQAKEAQAARAAEERALAKAETARVAAERSAARATRAVEKQRASLAALKKAEIEAKSKRAAAERGEKAGGLRKAKARATELAAAERSLKARRRELAQSQQNVKTLERDRAVAAAELLALQKAAAIAVETREREEARAKRSENARRQATAALATAQKRLASADADRRQAARELRAAKAERRQAERRQAVDPRRVSTNVRINDIKFVDKGNAARVVVGLSAPARPKVIRNRGNLAVLEIEGVVMAKELQRTLDTTAFGGPVKAISSYVDSKHPGTVRVVVDLFEPTQAILKKVGNTYYWDFPTSSASKARIAKRDANKRGAGISSYRTRVASSSFAGPSTSVTQQTVAQVRKRRRVYRGRRIDLNFKDADIHNLLRILATVGGVNIVVPQSVSGTVTVRLKSVPWDQAMEVILSSQELWYRRSGSLIRVAKRDVLEKEDEEAAKRRAAAIKAEAPEPEIFTLNYTDAKKIRTQLSPLLSPKGQLQVDSRTNSLIVNDIAAHRRRIIDLATRLDTQTPQIQIEARIVEARTTFTREFGIQWGGNASASPQGGNPTGLVFPNSIGVGGASGNAPNSGLSSGPTDFAVNLPAAIGLGSGGGLGLSLGSVGGNFNIALRLSALEDTGSARIISAPKITTSNNVKARIKSGVSIPISVVSANGTQTQFVPADLLLEVTPKVSQRDCSVSMEINVTKNEADFANTGARGDPSILTKEAATTVLVPDGETAVIGGIYTRNTGLNYSKVPFFADIPVLGYLFKKRRENDERSEVLVFITPKITNRAFLRCE